MQAFLSTASGVGHARKTLWQHMLWIQKEMGISIGMEAVPRPKQELQG